MSTIQQFLAPQNILVNQVVQNKSEAFALVQQLLVHNQAVTPKYLEAMVERDAKASCAIGNYIAILHGTVAAKTEILKNCIVLVHLKKPIVWDENEVRVLLGLALNAAETIDVVGAIGNSFADDAAVLEFFSQTDLTPTKILNWLASHE